MALSKGGAAGAVVVVALAASAALDRLAPFPTADVLRGSEDAFARGLQNRELPPRQAPARWTTPRAVFRFRHLPRGPAVVVVAVHDQRGPVAVAAGGIVLGALAQGATAARFPMTVEGGGLEVELRAEPFVAGDGRRLGARLVSVTLEHAPPGSPAVGVVLCILAPAVALVLLAMAAGVPPLGAALLSIALTSLEALALWPCGLVRSDYPRTLAVTLGGGAALAAGFALWVRRRVEGAGAWAFVAFMAALLVQGLAGTSPLMVVSDAVFHANNLGAVARGDIFLTSRTQHSPPFRIPYGFSFYALLAPLYRAGLDGVALVRGGAAVSGIAASALLFLLVAPTGAARAARAVLVLQLMPGTFDVYSYGNLSNVFAQAATVAFFAWWASKAPGTWATGAALLALGCASHLSGLVVLTALCAGLVAAGRSDRARLRPRAVAAVLGLGVAALYYLEFWGLIRDQLPRLLESGGHGPSRGALAAWQQVLGAVGQWGLPAIALGLLGLPRLARGGLDRDLAGFWLAGLALAAAAVVSPLEVRYIYALGAPLAVAAAAGFEALSARGAAGCAAAWGLLAVQAWRAAGGIVEAILYRYRP